MANVAFVRKDLKIFLKIYKLIRDCLLGENQVKKRTTDYLPRPNADDVSDENAARYSGYLERAVFYNVTGRTLGGMVGQIFIREPVIELPSQLDIIIEDANGSGISLVQSSKKAVGFVLGYGRAGLFTDYPDTGGSVTVKDLEDGDIRPTINLYAPWRIINWRTTLRGAKSILSLVVLSEMYVADDDGFEMKELEQFRVLRLGPSPENKAFPIEENVAKFTVEIWKSTDGAFAISETYQPKDSSGDYLLEIPFTFIGSENNDVEIDKAPLDDIASLNIAHYRNSADYEESSFIVGQPTPYFTGLTQEWVDGVLKGVITLGSRAAIPLPTGATAGLLQAAANIMPFEAMGHKENQMVALGAKLVEQKSVQRTATEANIEEASENSILSSSAKNVSEAYKFALEKCTEFMGLASEKITFELNTDFDLSSMTSEERSQVIAEWQGGALTFGEMRTALRKAGIATLDDEEAKAKIDAELDLDLDDDPKDKGADK